MIRSRPLVYGASSEAPYDSGRWGRDAHARDEAAGDLGIAVYDGAGRNERVQIVDAEGGEKSIRRGDQDSIRLLGWLVGDLGAGRRQADTEHPDRTVVAQLDPERRLGVIRSRHEVGADAQHGAVRAHEELFGCRRDGQRPGAERNHDRLEVATPGGQFVDPHLAW
jgi:hypothetical protein